MSWERTEYVEVAKCACGEGTVVRHSYIEDDDWNRIRDGVISEEICCDACKKNYHIEHYARHCFCFSWEGDGIVDKAYLVPDNLSIPSEIHKRTFSFELDEQIVAAYCLEEIINVKLDMIQNKYSTRLERQSSKDIVNLFVKKHKRRSLEPIVELLNYIENQYEKYEWTHQRLSEFRDQERIRIQENKKSIAAILDQSFELDFRRNDR